MKRIFSMLLIGILLMGSVGCQHSAPKLDDDPNITPLVMTPGDAASSYHGIEIRVDSLAWNKEENKTTLAVVWNNRTDYEVTYGASFEIERLEAGEWVSCAIGGNTSFPAIGYLLPAGKRKNETYTLTGLFDVSSPGIYRFKTDCFVADNTGQSTKCELVANFTIGDVKDADDGKLVGTEVEWAAQYIRTNGSPNGVYFPNIRMIDSLQMLQDYYGIFHEVFDLERKETVYSDTTIGFLDACDRYDEAFFEKNYLIFVLLEEGSGSIRHEVRSVEQTEDKKIRISIDRKAPEVCTADMAQWHIILELSRDVLVTNPIDTFLYIDGLPSYMDGKVVVPQTEAEFREPPAGTVRTPEGDVDLRLGGYEWIYALGNGLENAVIADQAGRPLPREALSQIVISGRHGETVYAPVPGTDTYAPTNSLGYLVKLAWETEPTSVTYACWPDTVWEKSDVPEENVVSQDGAFYAWPGGYVYEIAAAWEDTGSGCRGTANYYVYIVGGDGHSH